MIQIEDTLISDDIFEKKFVCDLNACKGECCIQGDAGAPLEFDELDILEEIIEEVKPYMRKVGLKTIEKTGVFEMDFDGEYVTPLNEGAECAFVTYDDKNIAKCAIEEAYLDGKISWKKPISCHLYPIRITKYSEFEALNYHLWEVCSDACALGEQLKVPVYQFLKEPLIRKYGEDWYAQLVAAYKLWEKNQ